ncbi:MAG TPA: hypothetical protein VGP70_25695 [Actinomadura sp.]|jgi:hypothetical protein|nr:hypothetical protein [Actinomadura sp.]
MEKRTRNVIVTAVTTAVAAGTLATGLAGTAAAGTVHHSEAAVASESFAASNAKAEGAKATAVKAVKGLPSGRATATSFWDPQTASGKPMRFATLASPYWPLGTTVRITYNGQSAVGVVEDFGPAEWAVAQHSPPAIVDLSEKMMAKFTGARENSVPVHFQVLKMGSGSVYRSSGTGYNLAMGK